MCEFQHDKWDVLDFNPWTCRICETEWVAGASSQNGVLTFGQSKEPEVKMAAASTNKPLHVYANTITSPL